MRVTLDLTPTAVESLHQLAKRHHRTVTGEVTWAMVRYIRANEFVKTATPETPPEEPVPDDRDPF